MRENQELANSKNLYWRDMMKNERIALICLMLLTVEYVAHYYMEIGILPKMIIYVNAFIAVFFPLYSLINSPKRQYRLYPAIFLLVFMCILIYTIVLIPMNGRASRDVVCITVYLQILAAIFYSDLSWDVIEKMFKITAILAMIGFVFAISRISNFNISVAIGRGYQYEEIFYYAALFWSAFPFMIMSLIRKRNVFFAGLNLVFCIVLNLITVKRIVLLQVGILIMIIFGIIIMEPETEDYSKRKALRNLLFIIAIALVVLRVFAWNTVTGLFDSVFERTIAETENNLSLFNRFQESLNYLNSASFFDLIMGKGLGGVHRGLGVVSEALHSGWVNFLLKGGIALFTLMFIPFLKALRSIFHYRSMPEKTRFAFWYILYMFPMLFMSNMHSFYPQLFLYVYCCIEMMGFGGNRNRGGKNETMGFTR